MENTTSILEDKLTTKTIGEIVADDYRKAEIFKKHGIDFCCKGNVTIAEVCEKKNVNYENLINELKAVDAISDNKEEDFNEWDLSELVDHIVQVHHSYVERSLPIIHEFKNKVCKVHGQHNPELFEIANNFDDVAEELTMHMHKEEMVLFPYIKKLNEAFKANEKIDPPHFATIRNPISMMELEHVSAGRSTENIRSFSNNYTPPVHACATYRVLFAKLEEFENDLHRHIHLENNILFKKAIELEKLVLKS